ncbi:unnamed protein product, partial [Choristocarpus tenellus]
GLIEASDVRALKPICLAFKDLYDVVKSGLEVRDHSIVLLRSCLLAVNLVLDFPKTRRLPENVTEAMRKLTMEMNDMMEIISRLSGVKRKPTRNSRKLIYPSRDRNIVTDHEKSLQQILAVLVEASSQTDFFPSTSVVKEMASVPVGTPKLPLAFVRRESLEEGVVNNITRSNKSHVLVGMGGWGKTVLASCLVRNEVIRSAFRDGTFWLGVGKGGKEQVSVLLQRLEKMMGLAPAKTHEVLHQFDDVEQRVRHMSTFISKGNLKCLVVLDDVWEREVLEPFLSAGFQLLVTTRDESLILATNRRVCSQVGGMLEDEAVELLRRTCGAVGEVPKPDMQQASLIYDYLYVASDCDYSPLALSIIGSMDSLRADPLQPESWRSVHRSLADLLRVKKDSLTGALSLCFDKLGTRMHQRLCKLAVLASGVLVPADMIAHLWEQVCSLSVCV